MIYSSNIDFKRNVIVMGDILEDLTMVRHKDHDVVLKIGFLNNLEKVGHLLGDFKNNFDLVIANDGSLHTITYLLESIFNTSKSESAVFEQQLRQIKGSALLREVALEACK